MQPDRQKIGKARWNLAFPGPCCQSAWDPDADQHDKSLKFLVSEGAYLDADTRENLLVGYFIKASTVHSTEILDDLDFDFVVDEKQLFSILERQRL